MWYAAAISMRVGGHMGLDGMTCWVSSYGMAQTMDRLRDAIREQGMSVSGQIGHAVAAAEVGLELRPLQARRGNDQVLVNMRRALTAISEHVTRIQLPG
jgi:hypothetical protein